MKKINFKEKFQKFSDQWSPKVIAEMNDYQFKLVKIQNDFIWHKHEDTDEVFIVLNGKIFIGKDSIRPHWDIGTVKCRQCSPNFFIFKIN